MNDKTDQNQDDELEGFDTFENNLHDDGLSGEPIDDADFQDIPDDLDADVFGDNEPAPPVKKKTNWFNIGVAVAAIALAGGLIWMKMGPQLMGSMGAGDQAPASVAMEPVNVAPGDSQQAAQEAVAPAGSGQAAPGLLDNPDQLANLGSMPAPPAPDANASPAADPFAGVPAVPAAPAPTAAPVAGEPAPEPVATAAESPVPMPAPISAAPAPATVEAPQPTPETVMPAPVVAENTSGLEGKVNALESRLDSLDAKISSLQAPADDGRLNAIQTTLERLESRLDSMASGAKNVVRSVSDSISDEAPPVKKAAPKKAAKPKAKTESWDKPYTPPSQAVSAPAPSMGSGGWELRGATAGRAIIAKGSDIREVGAGETVPGLGEITGVASVNGLWVVQGTTGRLSQ